MARRRIITELGAGADLHGRDFTKAAKRAVEDAMRHSSLSLFRGLELDPATMRVEILIGVAEPEAVDEAAVADVLPYGEKAVTVVKGGVTADGMGGPGDTIVASAAVTAFVEIPEGRWKLA
ncbi:MAG: Lin0512 family protein [Pseudomonadota bacterium]